MTELRKKIEESSVVRHIALFAVTILMIYLLSTMDTKFSFAFEILGTAILAVLVNIYISAFTVYAYTKINFVKGGNSEVVSKIYLGNALLVGLVFTGAYFVKFL